MLALAVVVSYANRAPLAMFGLDQINVMLTLYLCLGPCGAALSVDRWLARRRGESAAPTPHAAARLSLRLVQCHMCVIYFWAGVSKLQGVSWWTGDAVWRAAANYEYQQLPLTWLAYAPWLFQLATVSVWIWEIAFPFLVWRPKLRAPMLLVGVAMHIGIGMFLGMWTFGLVMTFAYVAFLPPEFVHRCLRRWRGDGGPHVAAASGGPNPELPVEGGPESAMPAGAGAAVVTPDGEAAALPSPDAQLGSRRLQAAEQASQSLVQDAVGDGLVVFLDRSSRRRCDMIQHLEAAGFRCVGVDAWPECLAVAQTLRPAALIFNGRRLQPSETAFWMSRMDGLGAVPPVVVALGEKLQIGSMERVTRGWPVEWLALPAELDDIVALLGKRPFARGPETAPNSPKPRSSKRVADRRADIPVASSPPAKPSESCDGMTGDPVVDGAGPGTGDDVAAASGNALQIELPDGSPMAQVPRGDGLPAADDSSQHSDAAVDDLSRDRWGPFV